jgi:glycosyltransferase involved in cell wall biosynthesis
MKLSIIIPCLNGAKTIKIQLNAISKQNWSEPWEVVVSDNGSTDESINIVKSYRNRIPNLKIVDASKMRDRAYACNIGVKASTGDSIAFCDVDDEIAPGWVAAMGEALSLYPFVACQHELNKLNPPWTKEVWKPSLNGPRTSYNFLPAAAGCRIGFQRSVFDAVNGFTVPGLRIEDRDFCWKAQLAGVRLHFVPEAVVHYRYRSTFASTFRQARLDGISEVMLYRKYARLGMPWRSWKTAVKAWIRILKSLFQISSKGSLLKWTASLGLLIGRLQGSIKFRSLNL